KVRAFADSAGLEIVADIPRSADIIKYEDMGKTVIEGDPQCETAQRFLALADKLIAEHAAAQ
ncbi:MAG TPA: nitrogen fixation protein NifH, partial [Ruminococcus sp.]|nr:nitrogen fixation protein NifH [Ruminococcus sp.]